MFVIWHINMLYVHVLAKQLLNHLLIAGTQPDMCKSAFWGLAHSALGNVNKQQFQECIASNYVWLENVSD